MSQGLGDAFKRSQQPEIDCLLLEGRTLLGRKTLAVGTVQPPDTAEKRDPEYIFRLMVITAGMGFISLWAA